MAAQYIAELFRRVFFPTTRGADYLSVIVPIALAVAAKFAGITVSEDTAVELLAYVGAFTVLLFLVRLFFTVPYAMWREQTGHVAQLKLELSKPEQIELRYISKARAKARMQLATAIRVFQWHMFHPVQEVDYMVELSRKMVKLHARVGEGDALAIGISILHKLWRKDVEYGSAEHEDLGKRSMTVARDLQLFLHGHLTAEALALRLPKDTESGTQQ